MKTLKNIFTIVLFAFLVVACKNENQPEVKIVDTEVAAKSEKVLNPDATYVKSEFTIDGMTCEIGCAKLIQRNINKMDGVKAVEVDFERKLAMVEYDEAIVNHSSLEAAVTKSSDTYKVSNMKTVESFSTKKECKEDCKKACCKNKNEDEKKACAENCTKPCCAEKKDKA